jgi:hypothetical protein
MNTVENLILEEIVNIISSDKVYIFINSGKGLDGIPKEILYKIREINNIDKDIEILLALYDQDFVPGGFFESARTYIWCAIFLEDRFCVRNIEETTGWDKKNDFVSDFYWNDIEEVKAIYFEGKDANDKIVQNFHVRVFSNSNNNFIDIPIEYFGLLSGEYDCNNIVSLINNIIEKLNNQNNENNNNLNLILEDIISNEDNGEFETALYLIKNNFDLTSIIDTDLSLYYFLVFYNALCLQGLGLHKEALKFLNEINLIKDYTDVYCVSIFDLRAELNENEGNYYSSMQDYQTSCENSNDIEFKNTIKEKLNSTYSKFIGIFPELNYDKRRTILINDGVKPSLSNEFVVLNRHNLPDNISFPFNHPKKEELYMAHPYIKKVYLPFASYEAILFNDRFEEFSYFIQCLGAKSMTIGVVRGNKTNNTNSSTNNLSSNVNFGKSIIKNELYASAENNKIKNEQEDAFASRVRKQKFNPIKKPYIPENLLWYPHETSWHRLYQQRINGNILQHHDVLSSKNSHSINEKEKSDLKVAFKNFFVDAKVNVDTLIEHTFTQNETIEWEIEIEFESIENLQDVNKEIEQKNSIVLLSNEYEKEYIEEIKFMLEDDGIIDQKERSILERFREKKGISNDRAAELENILTSISNFTENEKEYLEEYEEMLKDGEIAEKERKILNRFANRLGLLEERVSELEQIYIKN